MLDQQLLKAAFLQYSEGADMAEIKRRLFTIQDCYRMAAAGILRPDERVELIRGDIIQMSPIGKRHGAAVDRATRALVRLLGDRAIVRVQGTIELDQLCAPQPDLALLRPRDDFYVSEHPGAADIFLVIEVADSSLEYDTTTKLSLYAILGVPEYWVADLVNNRLLTYSDPHEDAYKITREFRRGDTLAPRLLPDCRIEAATFIP
jgi:Uma2 family endonuclease